MLDLENLQRAVGVLSDKIEESEEHIKQLNVYLHEEKAKGNNTAIEEYVQGTKQGLTGFNISSDKYHKKNSKATKLYFKFED